MSSLAELLDVEAPMWRQRAACRGCDPEVFFPPGDDDRVKSSVYARARSICAGCPVRSECLEDYLDELHGCFGGTSPMERRHLRRQHAGLLGAGGWQR